MARVYHKDVVRSCVGRPPDSPDGSQMGGSHFACFANFEGRGEWEEEMRYEMREERGYGRRSTVDEKRMYPSRFS
jgi:hypothetical protein